MKREDVKNKITGITEEQPNWLMQENGSDITREKFLSTLSLRRATIHHRTRRQSPSHFYPRSPCGERRYSCVLWPSRLRFLSTLSLRRATFLFWGSVSLAEFLSTLSLRRATVGASQGADTGDISIHALLAESDRKYLVILGSVAVISIHALLAESDGCLIMIGGFGADFYPRSPRGERRLGLLGWLRVLISIHALLAESDFLCE